MTRADVLAMMSETDDSDNLAAVLAAMTIGEGL